MSKSKKNVIDPENMIKSYGADAVLYNITSIIVDRKQTANEKNKDFENNFDNYVTKITNLIDNFQFNVVVANVYSAYTLFSSNINEKVDNKCLKENLSKLMKILIPFVPHLAHECLEMLGTKDIHGWPEAENKIGLEEKIKIAIQINGKTREVIEIRKNLDEKDVMIETKKIKKINEQLNKAKIQKIIFVKNKIINYLIK